MCLGGAGADVILAKQCLARGAALLFVAVPETRFPRAFHPIERKEVRGALLHPAGDIEPSQVQTVDAVCSIDEFARTGAVATCDVAREHLAPLLTPT
jgi:hypothetical protein